MRRKGGGAHATAEVFWTAFRALSKTERKVVVRRFVSEKAFREDLLDLAVFEKRRNESSRPFEDYLRDRAKKRA